MFFALSVYVSTDASFCGYWFYAALTTLTHVPRLTAGIVATASVVVFVLASWARAASFDLELRDLCSSVCYICAGAWFLSGAVTTGTDITGQGWYHLGQVFTIVGGTWLGTSILGTAVEQARTGTPTGHCLYRFYNERGVLLYVGITNNPRRRFREHRDSKDWWSQITVREVFHYATRADLEAAERAAIRKERPLYNIALTRTRR